METTTGNQDKNIFKLVVIIGPSASGKTRLAKRLAQAFGGHRCIVICQDDYYKDWSHLPKTERKKINFDHIRSFDYALLAKHLNMLKKGKYVNKPCYDFSKSSRLSRTTRIAPKSIIILEGLMPLLKKPIRELTDLSIYMSVENHVGLSRRLFRDVKERGESIETVRRRYFNEVLPMQKKYVERQKKWANLVVDGKDCCNKKVINEIKKLCLKHIKIK